MNQPDIEQLLIAHATPIPKGIREDVVSTIDKTIRQQTRRDDLRVVILGLGSLIIIALCFYGLALYQHSRIVKTIAALGEPAVIQKTINDTNVLQGTASFTNGLNSACNPVFGKI